MSKANSRKLTRKQRLFLTYLFGRAKGNAAEAARLAGYSPDYAKDIAYQNSTKLYLSERIEARANAIEMSEKEAQGILAAIGRGSLEDFITLDDEGSPYHDFLKAQERDAFANLKKLKTKKTKLYKADSEDVEEVTETEIELHDPIRAVTTLGRWKGWERKPGENPEEIALVNSFREKAEEIQAEIYERSKQFWTIKQVMGAMIGSNPEWQQYEPALRKHGLLLEESVNLIEDECERSTTDRQ